MASFSLAVLLFDYHGASDVSLPLWWPQGCFHRAEHCPITPEKILYPAFRTIFSRFTRGQENVTPARSGGGAVNRTTVPLGVSGARLDGYIVSTFKSDSNGRQTFETVETRQLVECGLAHNQVQKLQCN